MKKLFLFGILLLLTSVSALSAKTESQEETSQGVRLKGVTVDAVDKFKVIGAKVVVESAKDTITVYTNEKGEFVVDNVPKGDIEVNIISLGYASYTLQLRADGTQIDFGEIMLTEGALSMDEVTVVGEIRMMTSRGDTIVYNPQAFQTIAGDYAIDLIVKFPGIEIEDDGTITAHGEEVKWALVDGRLMFGRNIMNTIENVRADDIDEVKIYDIVDPDKPGAEVAKEKEDMQRVMDFSTKSKFTGAMNARLLGGLGKDIGDESGMAPWGRYKVEAAFGMFNEKRVLTMDALANNTKESQTEILRRFIGGGMGSGYRGGGSGYGRSNSFNLRFSNSNPFLDRYKWQGDISYRFNNSYDYGKSATERIRLDRNQITENSSENKSATDTHNLSIGIRKRWENASFNFDPNVSYSDGYNKSISDRYEELNDLPYTSELKNNNSDNNSFSTSGNIRFMQAFTRPESEIDSMTVDAGETVEEEDVRRPLTFSVNAGWSYSKNNASGLRDEWYTFAEGADSTAYVLTDTEGASKGANASASVGGIYLSPSISLRANYSFNYTYNKSLRMEYDEITQTINLGSSEKYTRHNVRNTIGTNLSFGRNDSKVTANLGLNYEALKNMRDESFPRSSSDDHLFHSFTPSFSIGNEQRNFGITKRYQWNFRYSTSTGEPSLEQLRDYVDNSTITRPVLGNPDLKQSYSHNASASFIIQNSDEATRIHFNLSGGYTFNSIVTDQIDIMEDTDINGVEIIAGSRLTEYRNVDGAKNASFRFSMSRPFIGNKFVLNTDARYAYNDRPRYSNNELYWNTSHAPSVNLGLRSNHSANIEYGLNNRFSYGFENAGGTNTRTLSENVGANLRIRFLKNFVIEADYAYKYSLIYRDAQRQDPVTSQLLNGSLAWEFAKRAGEIKFTMYDILNRDSGYSSTVNNDEIVNSWTQILGRFCMLTASFRFNKTYGGKGGSSSNAEGVDGPGPAGPGPGGPGPGGPEGRGGGPRRGPGGGPGGPGMR